MTPQEDFDKQIFKDRLNTLYSTTGLSATATLFIAAVYVFVQFSQHKSSSLLSWYALLVVIYACRILVVKRYHRADPSTKQQAQWLRWFRLGILTTGLTLGSISFIFYPGDDVPHQMFAVVLLNGMAAGGLTVLIADLVSFTIYVIVLLLPVIAVSFTYGDLLHISVSIMVIAFLMTIIRASRELNKLVTTSLQLRYENLSLVTSLEQEKSRLSNRLGRILNDSSNELFVLDGESLICLQVNKGAIQNLGYSRDELAGMTLLDIIVDLDKKEFKELVQPLQMGTQESVIHRSLHRRKDGSTYPVELRLQLSTQEDPPVFVATALDISERIKAERQLIHQANFDQLTKLPNRYYMMSHIGRAFARSRRNNTKVSLLFMDLDNFKDINDTLGHAVGDELLKQVADRIRSLLREADMPARLGGDEFLVMLEGLDHQEQTEVVAHKLSRCFKKPFFLDKREIYTSASIGISTYPDDGNSVDLLMQYADTAMYNAKQAGRSNYRFFSHELRTIIDEQLAIESRLRHAIKNNELQVFYQPKIDITDERIIGAEALLRWNNPDLGSVPPNIFIPIAEKYGLIENIGSWVLEMACREASYWQTISSQNLHIAVNISPQQFRSKDLLETVDNALQASGLPARLLEMEITESLLMQDTKEPLEILNTLRDRKISLSLDDFGTGYSSLSYLKRFPIQILKIDRSFINDLMDNQYNRSLVDAIIAMGHSLELRLVAEGVENHEQLDFLRKRNVKVVQGYLFSPPVSAEDFRALLRKP